MTRRTAHRLCGGTSPVGRALGVVAMAFSAAAIWPGAAVAVTVVGSPASFAETVVGAEQRATVVLLAEYPITESDELIGSVTIGGLAADDYRIDSDGCSGARVRVACRLTVVFRPSAVGERRATLTIPGANGSAQAELFGVGFVTGRSITVDPGTIDFGPVLTGVMSAPKMVTITNTGDLPLSVAGAAIGGSGADSFLLGAQTCLAGTLPAGAACAAFVRFVAPSSSGVRTAELAVDCAPRCSQRTVLLTANAFPPPSPGIITQPPELEAAVYWTFDVRSARANSAGVTVRMSSSIRTTVTVRVLDGKRVLASRAHSFISETTIRLRPRRSLRRGRSYAVQVVARASGRSPITRTLRFRR